jgi:hypothetical protein
MPNYPASLKMVPYSQRPTYLGVAWDRPGNVDVDRYELYLSPKSIGNNEVQALLTGAKAGEGVVKVALPADCNCVLDNRSPQGQRIYYTVFAVDKTGNYHQPNFQVNDSVNMDLKNPTFLKEPYTPTFLKFIPYGQRPDGIGISWEAPAGDWTSYRVVVLTGKSINRPEDFEKLFAGQLDFAKLYEVPAGTGEAIDDASPQGSRNYYSVVAVDKKGNMMAVEKFQTVEGSQAKFKAPVRFAGTAPGAGAPTAPKVPPPGTGKMEPPVPPASPAPPYPSCVTKPALPCDQPRVEPAVPTPVCATKYPSKLSTIPSTQHIYGTRIRIKDPRPDLRYRIIIATKSINKPEDAIEGRLDFVKVFDHVPDADTFVDNVTDPYARCYYAVLGLDAQGNCVELPFEVRQPDGYVLSGAKLLDPNKRWALPSTEDDWLLKTTEKGVELVPDPQSSGRKESIGPYVNQVWEGTRIRIKHPKKEYIRYQLLIASNYIYKEKLLDGVQGRSDYIKAYEIPVDALELIDNITQPKTKVHVGLIGWDKEGNGYNVELDFPSPQYAEFKAPRFVDPTDLARVKAAADEVLAEGRKVLASIGGDKQSLFSTGPDRINLSLQYGAKAQLVYPMYDEIPRYLKEVVDRNGWLFQARFQFECEAALAKADVDLKGDQQPYAFPNYGGAEDCMKIVREKQAEAKTMLQKHISEAPWSSNSEWYGQRLKQFEENEVRLKRLVDHITELKARDAKAKALYEKARGAHSNGEFDEAIKLYGEVMKVKPEWDTNQDIATAKDDKEFAGQIAAAGTNLSKFKAIYDDWMERGKSDYAWNALGKAFARIGDKASFLLYSRELFKHEHYSDVVNLFREIQSSKEGFIEGIFGADKVKTVGLQLEEADAELRRIDEAIRDMDGKLNELQREDSKLVGSGYSDYRTSLQNDIERVRHAIERERERSGELWKRMATILAELLGKG